MIRRGFTLMEIMVSLLIFSVVSLALIGVLSAAVKLFRAGEAGRAASDETIATLAQLDDDLKRMVPAADGGFLFCRRRPTTALKLTGNMALAFKIRNPVGSQITEQGYGARLIVVWWVDDAGILNRQSATAADSDADPNTTSEYTVATTVYGSPRPVANGCLYFGIDLSLDANTRPDLWWSSHIPLDDTIFCTEAIPNHATPDLFPAAMRITTVLTGGSRNFVRGRCVRDDSNGIRITGVGQVPVGTGVMARLGDPKNEDVEWVTYSTFKGGVLNCTTADRAQRRTAQFDATGKEVTFAPSYTLVRTLPR